LGGGNPTKTQTNPGRGLSADVRGKRAAQKGGLTRSQRGPCGRGTEKLPEATGAGDNNSSNELDGGPNHGESLDIQDLKK